MVILPHSRRSIWSCTELRLLPHWPHLFLGHRYLLHLRDAAAIGDTVLLELWEQWSEAQQQSRPRPLQSWAGRSQVARNGGRATKAATATDRDILTDRAMDTMVVPAITGGRATISIDTVRFARPPKKKDGALPLRPVTPSWGVGAN